MSQIISTGGGFREWRRRGVFRDSDGLEITSRRRVILRWDQGRRAVKLQANGNEFEFALDDGTIISIGRYDRLSIDGLGGDLTEGATFTMHDGCTVTRRGNEAVWMTPGRR